MTRPLTDKYPLAAKAFGEQDAFIRKVGGSADDIASLAAMADRIADIIENNVDRADNEKEALIAAAALSFIPTTQLGGTERLSTEYNATVRSMVEDLAAGPRTTPNENTAQIGIAVYTATLENLMVRLAAANPADIPVDQVVNKLAQETTTFQMLEKHAGAPKLADLFGATLDQLDVLLTDIAEKQASFVQPEFEDLQEELRKILSGNDNDADGEMPSVEELRAEADGALGLTADFNDAAAHQILGAFDAGLMAKYPDTRKALQDLTRANGMCEEPLTPETVAGLSRAVGLLDLHAEGDDAEKHDMAVALVLSRMSPDLESFGYAQVFNSDYNAGVQSLMKSLYAANGGATPDAKTQAVIFASNIAEVEQTIAQVNDGKIPPSEMAVMKQAVTRFAEKVTTLQVADSAKRLGDTLEEAFITLIDAIDAKTPKAPKPPRP